MVDPLFKNKFINYKCRQKPWNHRNKCHSDNDYINHYVFSFNKNTPVNPPSNVPQTIAHPLLINGVNAVLISIAMIAINQYLISFFTGGISRQINNSYIAISILWLFWFGINYLTFP